MYIDIVKNHGKPYLRLVQSIRRPNKEGKKVPSKEVLLNIGPLAKYDDGKPDYVKRLRQSFRDGHPLIPELKEYCMKERKQKESSHNSEFDTIDCTGRTFLFSAIVVDRALSELGVTRFILEKCGPKKWEDIYYYLRLIITKQIIEPSASATRLDERDRYFDPVIRHVNMKKVNDLLAFIYDNINELKSCLNRSYGYKNFCNILCYHSRAENSEKDNLYNFDISSGQYEFGNVGKEKERGHTDYVVLYTAEEGLLINMQMFKEGTLNKNIINLRAPGASGHFTGYIIIDDYSILDCKNTYRPYMYIAAKSLFYSSDEDRQWAYTDGDYIRVGDMFKYKDHNVKRSYINDDGNKETYTENVIILWSKELEERDKIENRNILNFLDQIENSEEFTITDSQKRCVQRFIGQEYVDKLNGDLNSSQLRSIIDEHKIRTYLEHPGYFQIVTSETWINALYVITYYYDNKQAERQFRSMNSAIYTGNFDISNVEDSGTNQVICMIAMMVTGYIKIKITEYEQSYSRKEEKSDILLEMPIERIQEALSRWQVEKFSEDMYRFLNLDDSDLQIILKALDINIPRRFCSKSEIDKWARH